MDLSASPSPRARNSQSTIFTIAAAAIGGTLIVAACAANQTWLDRHFLPSFFLPRTWYVLIETAVRILVGATGVLLAVCARRAGRVAARTRATLFPVIIAAVLALGASEVVLRRFHIRAAEWLVPTEEPRRTIDAHLGWTIEPSHVGQSAIGGRTIEYASDRFGYRVRSAREPVDPDRPTLVFAGESVMFGEGLTWDESIPAQVGTIMGVQTANMAVHGFGTDQTYLRLERELPRFRQPAAVITLFMPALFGRNLDDDRPHLDNSLGWLPAREHGRLISLAKLLVPFRRDETVERGIEMTRQVLLATTNLARTRGAIPLIVVPQLGPEDSIERMLRRRILDETGLPYVWVEIDSAWRLPWDRHPNARAARQIADAIVARLHTR